MRMRPKKQELLGAELKQELARGPQETQQQQRTPTGRLAVRATLQEARGPRRLWLARAPCLQSQRRGLDGQEWLLGQHFPSFRKRTQGQGIWKGYSWIQSAANPSTVGAQGSTAAEDEPVGQTPVVGDSGQVVSQGNVKAVMGPVAGDGIVQNGNNCMGIGAPVVVSGQPDLVPNLASVLPWLSKMGMLSAPFSCGPLPVLVMIWRKPGIW
ncbi:hypothetical protein NDU88_004653 [Pleurodeles waltl]|uniref:Uncharacterized protein n=1 Tax=Pleurodeles waltl TaxID=8319 RepID=A0AAV7KYE8_PLEWA|nr:hypothetical protein NDU88_004653 [Pleurodeles waltl]